MAVSRVLWASIAEASPSPSCLNWIWNAPISGDASRDDTICNVAGAAGTATSASPPGAPLAELVGGATWGADTAGAFLGTETRTDLTLTDATLCEDDFATPADLPGCPDGPTAADRSCRVGCGADNGATLTVVGFGFTFLTTYEFRNSSAFGGARLVSMSAALSTW
jgi:hypothetical protein